MNSLIEKIFKLKENNTNLKSEFLGGFTSFITMAYIIFVNPQIMSLSGMDQGAVFVGTCLAAALACILMGLFANWPVGLAPGMGLNAFFTFTVVGEMGYAWEVALGAVFLAGVLLSERVKGSPLFVLIITCSSSKTIPSKGKERIP